MENNILQNVTEHKHLGLTFQKSLSWSNHINTISCKAEQKLNILKQFKYKLTKNSLLTIYKSFILPCLEYGDIIFDNCTNKDKYALESVQLEAMRAISGAKKCTSHECLYNETGLVPLAK